MLKLNSLGWMASVLTVLIVLTFLASTLSNVFILQSREADGLLINLAGRQRMLTQKFTKEFFANMDLLLLHNEVERQAEAEETDGSPSTDPQAEDEDSLDLSALGEEPSDENQELVDSIGDGSTERLFEKTLDALQNGGVTWADLKLTQEVELPHVKDDELAEHLRVTRGHWENMRTMMGSLEVSIKEGVIPADKLLLDINEEGLACLANMNKGVVRLQQLSETKNSTMLRINFIGLGLVIILSIIIIRYMRPISQLYESARFARKLASGDFRQRLEINGQHEISKVNGALNQMCDDLSGVMIALRDDSVRLEDTSKSLSKASSELSSDTQAVLQNTSEISQDSAKLMTFVTDISGSATEVDQDTHEVAASIDAINTELTKVDQAADDLAVNCSEQATAVQEMAETLENISEKTRATEELTTKAAGNAVRTSEMVRQLGQSTGKVASVVSLIKNVAEQTNLLALNASIEAASAGDAGKGFGVVANEIKELARKTNLATGEINATVMEMQDNANQATDAINQIADVMHKVDGAFEAIVSAVLDQNSAVNQISSNLSENATASRHVKENIHTASGQITSANHLLQGLAKKTESMNHLAGRTQRATDRINNSILEVEGNMSNTTEISKDAAQSGVLVAESSESLNEILERFQFE